MGSRPSTPTRAPSSAGGCACAIVCIEIDRLTTTTTSTGSIAIPYHFNRSGALAFSTQPAEAEEGGARGKGRARDDGEGGTVRRLVLTHAQPMIGSHASETEQVSARLAARPGGPGGSALLAPEAPGDIAVIEIGSHVAQQQQPAGSQEQGPGAVVVVRGAAAVLAR